MLAAMNGTSAVIVVVSLERAERTLLAGDMPCAGPLP
jgi:hypothetical protein